MSDLTAEELALFGDGPVTPAAPAEPDDFGWDDEPAAPVKSTMPGHTGTTVTDGPGWVSVECSVCWMLMGKRPPGHTIDPSLCPNVKSHDAAIASKAKTAAALVPSGPPPADIPAPSASEPVPASVPTQTPAPSVVPEKAKRGRKPVAATLEPATAVTSSERPVAREHHEELKRLLNEQGKLLADKVVVVEFGPETLAVLRALIK